MNIKNIIRYIIEFINSKTEQLLHLIINFYFNNYFTYGDEVRITKYYIRIDGSRFVIADDLKYAIIYSCNNYILRVIFSLFSSEMYNKITSKALDNAKFKNVLHYSSSINLKKFYHGIWICNVNENNKLGEEINYIYIYEDNFIKCLRKIS